MKFNSNIQAIPQTRAVFDCSAVSTLLAACSKIARYCFQSKPFDSRTRGATSNCICHLVCKSQCTWHTRVWHWPLDSVQFEILITSFLQDWPSSRVRGRRSYVSTVFGGNADSTVKMYRRNFGAFKKKGACTVVSWTRCDVRRRPTIWLSGEFCCVVARVLTRKNYSSGSALGNATMPSTIRGKIFYIYVIVPVKCVSFRGFQTAST